MAGRGILLALSSALAFGAGLALGWTLHPGVGERALLADGSTAPSSVSTEELAPLLVDLRRALEALTAEVNRRGNGAPLPEAEPSQRRRPEESATDSRDLASAVQSLADAVQALRGGATAPAASHAEELVPPAFVDREPAFAATGIERLLGADLQPVDEKVYEAARNKLNQSHLFLTSQAVLSRYGLPDFREFDGSSERWNYVLQRENHAVEFTFTIHDGTVFACEFDTQ